MRMYEQGAALALVTCAEEVAHELASPIAALGMLVDEVCRTEATDRELRDLAKNEIHKLRTLIGGMRSVDPPTLETKSVSLSDFVSELGCGAKLEDQLVSQYVVLPSGWKDQIAIPVSSALKDSGLRWEATLSLGKTTTLEFKAHSETPGDKFFAFPWQPGALGLSVAKRLLRAHGHQIQIKTVAAFWLFRLQFEMEKPQ